MIEPLIRLALKRGWAAGSIDGHWCEGDCDSSCSDLPQQELEAMVDEFMSKYAPMFRDQFSDHH